MRRILLLGTAILAGVPISVAYLRARSGAQAGVEVRANLVRLSDSTQRFEEDVFKLKSAILVNHDGIVGALGEARNSLRSLAGLAGHEGSRVAWQACSATFEEKSGLAERVRIRHAVLKNSLDYLPELERIMTRTTYLGSAGEGVVKDLVRDVLIHERTGDSKALESARYLITVLTDFRRHMPGQAQADLDAFLAHAAKVLESTVIVDRDLRTLDRIPLRRNVEGLRTALGTYLEGKERSKTIAGTALIFLGGLVLAEVLFSLFAARRGARRLEAEKAELEAAVLARTRQLAQRDAESRAVLESVGDGVLSLDPEGSILTSNAAAQRMFGRSASELAGCRFASLVAIPWSIIPDLRAVRETTGIRRDESGFPLELYVSRIVLDGRVIYSVTLRDLTEAKRVEALKSDFVSTVSHELRTPLTSIRGALGLVANGYAGTLPEKARGMVDIAAKNCERLVGLVNDILDIEKIASGKMVLKMRSVDLSAFLPQALNAQRPFAQTHDVQLTFEGEVDEARIMADPDRLAQVLANLVSNACKYSPRNGTVRVGLRRAEAGFRVSVEDRGPGIPEEFRSRIFQRFAQANNQEQRRGTGLGLAITKSLVEQMGGALSFESEVGRGTTFFFDFSERADSASAPSGDPGAGRSRILVCEDDPDIARVLSAMLDSQGFDSEIAAGLTDAKRALATRDFAAMTLDLMLPDGDAMDFLTELRRNPKTSYLPVIVISACLEEVEGVVSGGAAGVLDWLDKPVQEDRLKSALARVIRGAGARKPRILHVEDEADIRGILAALIEDSAEIRSATTVLDAWEKLKAEDFDLIILDVGLPDGSGLELLPALHRTTRAPIPVLVFSAHEISPRFSRQVSEVLLKAKTTNDELLRRIRWLLNNPMFGSTQVRPAVNVS